jgi:hypothetical protein
MITQRQKIVNEKLIRGDLVLFFRCLKSNVIKLSWLAWVNQVFKYRVPPARLSFSVFSTGILH